LSQREVVFASLKQDLDALHGLVDVAKKIALKKEQLIPKWLPIVDEYCNSGAHYPFEPLMYLVVWLLDAEQIDKALHYAAIAIAQQQKMPDRFSRDLATFTTVAIHDWAQRQLKAGHSPEPFLTQVIDSVESKRWLVNEPIALGMLFKVAAMFAEHETRLDDAEKYYLKCAEANPLGHGIKTKLSALQKKLGKALTMP